MKNLFPGLRKFSETVYPNHQPLFESLSQGQTPHTLMITCSDSRIDPNMVTQTAPGELFVVRNAGNIVPPFGSSQGGEEAAIEFAIEGLKVSNIVVCGHSKCGAMAALGEKVDLTQLPSVKSWLNHASATRRRIRDRQHECSVNEVVEENVLVQIDNLKTHPSVSAALRSGRIHIYAWVYHFEHGTVSVYDPKNKKYVPSIEVKDHHENDPGRYSL
jgi:carbonic anhydrase